LTMERMKSMIMKKRNLKKHLRDLSFEVSI